ncbi:MAG: P27 family phage terminase small subunit [Christensenellales bacterium]
MTVDELIKKTEGRKPAKSKKAEAEQVPAPAKQKEAPKTVASLLEKDRDLTRTKIYRDIRRDLLEQLERNGTVGEQFKNLVDDYMKMWVIKERLVADIKERGVLVPAVGPGGREYMKKNDSVDQLPKYNAQMMKLLNEIGIKPDQNPGDDDVL